MPVADRLTLDRVELADITGPVAMASAIHRQLGQLSGSVPIDRIAHALDITKIRKTVLDGCEGVLLTDRRRNFGMIAVNSSYGWRRARFSVAHELAHFLLEDHELGGEIGFLCSREDMLVWGGQTRHQRQETEANRFAIELLAPPHLMNRYLSNAPDLRSTLQARKSLDISLEAATRRYVELHQEPLAAVMTKANVVRYALRSRQFPRIKLTKGDRIAPLTHSAIASGRCGVGEWAESNAAAWLDRAHCELFEQTRLGEDGYAITLLWAARRRLNLASYISPRIGAA